MDKLQKITLVSELDGVQESPELFFGGCGAPETLGERLALDTVTAESVVLSPPFFMRSDFNKAFFTSTNKILYDHKEPPSHIKLYLLEKPKASDQKSYELWAGSANATPQGIGWDFQTPSSQKPKSPTKENIECLVKFTITKEQFETLKADITSSGYVRYDVFISKRGSLQVSPDQTGPFIVAHYKCTKVEHVPGNSLLRFTLQKKGKATLKTCDKNEKVVWKPLEYAETYEKEIGCSCQDELTLEAIPHKGQRVRCAADFSSDCTVTTTRYCMYR